MSKQEERKAYYLNILFNKKIIQQVTITDHYKEKHPDITDELIIQLLERKLNGKRVKPDLNYLGKRKVFVWNTLYQGKNYRLIFWYDDNNLHGLWIKNCFRID